MVKGPSILQVTDFFHPRVEEFCGTLPVRLGRYIEDRPKLSAWIDRRINRGRRIRTDGMIGFVMLWAIGGLRRWLFPGGALRAQRLPVPVIVVGNLTVGGSGKTPLVLWLVECLRAAGWRTGISSRGYGGSCEGVRAVAAWSGGAAGRTAVTSVTTQVCQRPALGSTGGAVGTGIHPVNKRQKTRKQRGISFIWLLLRLGEYRLRNDKE